MKFETSNNIESVLAFEDAFDKNVQIDGINIIENTTAMSLTNVNSY